ncbi:MAG: nucleotidyltransferase family protein [Candidatus Thermoplasmatota archaeon]|nr:nucleotidyltransferase family protein [Candidatus Thermoplasmatota archaeon]
MQTVILAGGKGTRLGDLTRDIPKGMIKINNKPFLEYQIDLLRRNNISKIVLCVGYLSEHIMNYFGNGKKFGVSITYSIEKKKLLGTAGALKNAEQYLEKEFFVMYGDVYLPIDFGEIENYFKRSNKTGLMVVYKNYNKYDKSNTIVKDNFVIDYDKEHKKKGMVYIDYGVVAFRKDVLSLIPQNKFYHLDSVFKTLIEKKDLLAFETYTPFYEIGSVEGLKRFERMIVCK